jgi:hypothetical protein
VRFAYVHERSGEPEQAAKEGGCRRIEAGSRQHAHERSRPESRGEHEREPADPDERRVVEAAAEEEGAEREGAAHGHDRCGLRGRARVRFGRSAHGQ